MITQKKNVHAKNLPLFGTIHGYCQSQDCMVRTVEMKIKNLDREPVPATMHCPVCGSPLSQVRFEDVHQRYERESKEARCNVNVQRYARDHGPFVPLGVMCDDSLPHATPDASTPPEVSRQP